MRTVTGVFSSLDHALKTARALEQEIGRDRIHLLAPGDARSRLFEEPTTPDMAPVNAPISAVLGGVVTAGVVFALPVVGTVTAAGIGAMVLGALGGAAVGWQIGDALDRALEDGLPVDELYVYEDALRKGRTVILVHAEDADQEHAAQKILERGGAESVDAAREQWWLGIRDAEQAAYPDAEEFRSNEEVFRQGFVAGMSPRHRGQGWDEARKRLDSHPARIQDEVTFRRGFERAHRYLEEHRRRLDGGGL